MVEAWFPGVQAGNAVADVLFGKVNPGGKLPVSFPRRVGQMPIHYNHEPTGRPCDVTQKYVSRYRDLDSCAPQFPFGFGLSYTTFDVGNLQLSSRSVGRHGSVRASVDVTNTGDGRATTSCSSTSTTPSRASRSRSAGCAGSSASRSSRAEADGRFNLDASDFGFYDNRGRFVVEPGRIDVYAGDSSDAEATASFTVR